MKTSQLLRNILNVLTYYLCVGVIVDVTGTYSFNVANSHTQCGDRAYKFWSNMHIPLSQCISECGRRPKCLALNHHSRYSNYCELLETTEVVTPGDGGCTYLRREDIDLSALAGNGCECSSEESCDLATNTCSKTECSSIRAIDNGQIFGNRFSIGNSYVIKCNQGYEPDDGVNSATCLGNAQWDKSPSCKKMCATLGSLLNGAISGTSLYFSQGTRLQVTCDNGYREASGLTQITCLYTAVWDNAPECVLIECSTPSIQNGALTGSTFTAGSTYTVQCYPGYEEKNSRAAAECMLSGYWDYTPDCDPCKKYWFGLRRYSQNGAMEWLGTNDAVSYENFALGQPAGNSEYCGFLWESDEWKWHDGMCNWTEGFICEKPSA